MTSSVKMPQRQTMLTTSSSRRQLPLPLSTWRALPITTVLSILLALSSLPHLSANQTQPRGKFKAAVYEHAVILPRHPYEIVTREEALSVMRRNLEVYEVQAEEAERQGADLLVFPEDGLYGFRFTWRSLTPYLEYIPDPTVVDWIPCEDPGRFPDTEVQRALSCMARNHSLYVVANMGDRQPCHHQVLPKCNHIIHDHDNNHDDSGDAEHVQYNTDVAFDPTGKLVARYHKQNLFFEKQFDTPPTPEHSTFDTPFGRWGMFTCFDVLFYQPAIALVQRLGVANIAFPTAWMDALPLLASVEFHSAFARGMGVNFLAANIHFPQWGFQGSGVYTPKGMAAFVHNSTHTSRPRLIVTDVDVLDKPQPEALLTGNRKSSESFREVTDGSDVERSDLTHAASSNTATNDATVYSDDDNDSNSTSTSQISEGASRSSTLDYETAFVSELFHDLFNFVELERAEDTLHVCHRNVCCNLTYSMDKDFHHPELFAFGAFDGLHTYEGSYYLQICVLVRCADDKSRHSCGSPTNQSSTVFDSLTLWGEMQTDYVYPEVLLVTGNDQLRLADAKEWSFRDGIIRSDEGFSYPLLASALFGRWYERDSDVVYAPTADSEDVKDAATAGFVSGERMVMVVLGCVVVVTCVLL